MNRYYIIILCTFVFWCTGCEEEDACFPSGADKNWYVVSPSDDPLDKLIYEVYTSSHVPIFYNDTIGREDHVDKYGQGWTYYEILDPNYAIESSTQTVKYSLCDDREHLKLGVEFLRDEVLSRLPAVATPKCFLLVKEVSFRAGSSGLSWEPGNVYRGIGCTVVGRVEELSGMSDTEKAALAYEIVGEELGVYLEYHYADLLNSFYKISDATIPGGAYGVQISNMNPSSVGYEDKWKYWYEYGFLNCDKLEGFFNLGALKSYDTPSKRQDVTDFIIAILTMTDEDFEAEYGQYTFVMRKYNVLKDTVRTLIK